MPLANMFSNGAASPSPSKSSRFSMRPSTSHSRLSMFRPSSPMWGATASSSTSLATPNTASQSPSSPSTQLCIRCKCELSEEDMAAVESWPSNLPLEPASPVSPSPRNLVQRATRRLSVDLLTRRSSRPLEAILTEHHTVDNATTGLGLELGEATPPTSAVNTTQHVAASRSPAKKLAGWLRRSPSVLLSSPSHGSPKTLPVRATSPILFDVPDDPFSATPPTPSGQVRLSRAVSLSASVGLEVGWGECDAHAADRVSTATFDTILSRSRARPLTPPAHALRASRSVGAFNAFNKQSQHTSVPSNAHIDSETDVISLASTSATTDSYGQATERSPSSSYDNAFEFDDYADYLRYGGLSASSTAESSDDEAGSSTSESDESTASDVTTTIDSPLIKQRARLFGNAESLRGTRTETNSIPFPSTPPRQLLLLSRVSPNDESSPVSTTLPELHSRIIPLARRHTKQAASVQLSYALKPLTLPHSSPTLSAVGARRTSANQRPRTAQDHSSRPTVHLKPLLLHSAASTATSPGSRTDAKFESLRSPVRTTAGMASRANVRPAFAPPVGLRKMRSRAMTP